MTHRKSLLAAFGLALALALPGTGQAGDFPGIGIQLYSVRDLTAKDMEGTLRQLAELGFDGVEFAGEFGEFKDRPDELKALLDSLGLKGSAAHVRADAFSEANFATTVDFYQRLGVNVLINPWDERAWSPDGVAALAAELDAVSKKLAPLGMRTGFHNHAGELGAFGDTTFWDYLATHTGPEVILQLDIGWARAAGKDPAALVRQYPGRTQTTHYKVKYPEGQTGPAFVGEDDFDWAGLLQANVEVGGTEWLVLEQEDYPDGLSSMECVTRSKRGLDRILAEYHGK